MSNSFIVCMGIATVFIGLISIIILTSIIGAICNAGKKKKVAENISNIPSAPIVTEIANRQEIIAAVSAVIAEELGTDISAIRIHSFKKI